MRKDLFACTGKINILGLVAVVVGVSPDGLHRGTFANNNDEVTGLQVPAHEKTNQGRQYCTASLWMPAQIRAAL